MKRFKLIGAMIVAMLALAGAFTSSASAAFALPQVLPSTLGDWTGANVGTALFLTLAGLHIQCTTASGTGTTEASKTLGLFHIEFSGCAALPSGTCTGLGDTPGSGIILVLGTWHTVIDVDEPNLAAAYLLLLEETHFVCASLGSPLIRVRGSVLCLVLEPLVKKATHEFHCTQTSGMADETKYLNDSGVLTAITPLASSTNALPFEEAGELALGTVTYLEAVLIDD
jgi:hypothetical protein